jgi:hypothetical protein
MTWAIPLISIVMSLPTLSTCRAAYTVRPVDCPLCLSAHFNTSRHQKAKDRRADDRLTAISGFATAPTG